MPATKPRLYDLVAGPLHRGRGRPPRQDRLPTSRPQITDAGGAVDRNDDWHQRPLAYEINHQGEGEYHLLQFTGPTSLLESLSHNLRIDDAVLRFPDHQETPGHAAGA